MSILPGVYNNYIMTIFICMFVSHFFGDFFFQPRKIAKHKSTNMLVLLTHVGIVSVCMLVGLNLAFDLPSFDNGRLHWAIVMATLLNGVIHFCIDATTWNTYTFFNKRRQMPYTASGVLGPIIYDDKWWWTTLGFDQLLHGLTIILVIYLFFA